MKCNTMFTTHYLISSKHGCKFKCGICQHKWIHFFQKNIKIESKNNIIFKLVIAFTTYITLQTIIFIFQPTILIKYYHIFYIFHHLIRSHFAIQFFIKLNNIIKITNKFLVINYYLIPLKINNLEKYIINLFFYSLEENKLFFVSIMPKYHYLNIILHLKSTLKKIKFIFINIKK